MTRLFKERGLVGFVIYILLLQGFGGISWADALVMPRELVDYAHANGCAPIDDFFERPGMINPPFVYGWLSGDPALSAFFWCKKTEKGEKPYRLVFMVGDQEKLAGCPASIEWWNQPRGLSIEKRSHLSLADFKFVAEPKRSGPKIEVVNAKVILNSYDGVGNIFYCYKGQWLFSSFD